MESNIPITKRKSHSTMQIEKDRKKYYNHLLEDMSKELFIKTVEEDGRFCYKSVPGASLADGVIELKMYDVSVGVQLKSCGKPKISANGLHQYFDFKDIKGYENKIIILLAISHDLSTILKMHGLLGSDIEFNSRSMPLSKMSDSEIVFDWLEEHLLELIYTEEHPKLLPQTYSEALLECSPNHQKERINIMTFEKKFPFLSVTLTDSPCDVVDFYIDYDNVRYNVQLKSIIKANNAISFRSTLNRKITHKYNSSFALTDGIDVFVLMFADDERREKYAYMLTTYELFNHKHIDIVHFDRPKCNLTVRLHPPCCRPPKTNNYKNKVRDKWTDGGFLDLSDENCKDVVIAKLLQSKTERSKIRKLIGIYAKDPSIDIDSLRIKTSPLDNVISSKKAVETLLPVFCNNRGTEPFTVTDFINIEWDDVAKLTLIDTVSDARKRIIISSAFRSIISGNSLIKPLSKKELIAYKKGKSMGSTIYYRYIGS
jgi:hypothetical protein